MQENHRNGQDDSDIAVIANVSQPRELRWTDIISSADYNWLKKGPAN